MKQYCQTFNLKSVNLQMQAMVVGNLNVQKLLPRATQTGAIASSEQGHAPPVLKLCDTFQNIHYSSGDERFADGMPDT